jgi:hypothetical protein
MTPIKFRVREITRYDSRGGLDVKVTLKVVHGRENPPWPITGEIVLNLTRQDEAGQFDIGEEFLVAFEAVG